MRMRSTIGFLLGLAAAAGASANEITLQNDSLANNTSGTIQAGFVANEKAAAWLTTPCDGDIVAVQVFWRSLTGGAPLAIEDSIEIDRAGPFPVPGALAETIGGPSLTDGVLNEFRYLDENNTIPLSVPVVADETFVVALTFAAAPDPTVGPSVVDDDDGIHPNRNAIYASLGGGSFAWFSNSDFGVTGDWVIRAVVDCQSTASLADVSAALAADPPAYSPGAPLTYTLTLANAGPAAAASVTVVDTFPAAFESPSWTCTADGGASCGAAGGGTTLAETVSLPAGSSVVYTIAGTVSATASGTLSDSATAVVNAPASDPDPSNNTATLDLDAALDDGIFASGFDPP